MCSRSHVQDDTDFATILHLRLATVAVRDRAAVYVTFLLLPPYARNHLPLCRLAGISISMSPCGNRRGWQVALHIARGLHHMHSRKVMHLDLKSANILLARDGTAKVADVGLAKILTRDNTHVSMEGTFDWAAPEVHSLNCLYSLPNALLQVTAELVISSTSGAVLHLMRRTGRTQCYNRNCQSIMVQILLNIRLEEKVWWQFQGFFLRSPDYHSVNLISPFLCAGVGRAGVQ